MGRGLSALPTLEFSSATPNHSVPPSPTLGTLMGEEVRASAAVEEGQAEDTGHYSSHAPRIENVSGISEASFMSVTSFHTASGSQAE